MKGYTSIPPANDSPRKLSKGIYRGHSLGSSDKDAQNRRKQFSRPVHWMRTSKTTSLSSVKQGIEKHKKARSCLALITVVPPVPVLDAIPNTSISLVDTAGAQGVVKGSFYCSTCNITFEEQHALDLHGVVL